MAAMDTAYSGETGPGVGTLLVDWALEYDTQKIVHIKNKTIGVLNRLLQLAIIGYIIGYAIIYEKSYQSTDTVISSVTTKLKGVSYTNISNFTDLNIPVEDTGPYNRIWDVSDYVIPPQQSDAFFVMTNMVITPDQHRDQCPEDPKIPKASCTEAEDCPKGMPIANGNGVRTGNCIPYFLPNGTSTGKTCEIEAWCPVEYNVNPTETEAILKAAKNFTVLIKNTATYSKFKFSKRNILESSNKTYLQGCNYNNHSDQFCPIFRLGNIVAEAGEDFDGLAYSGGVMAISINWDCNLDYSWTDCKPKYSFARLDNKNAKLAKGYNFRFSHYYKNDSVDYRTLYKAYGIFFKVIVTGTAGKFDFVPLMLNIGSGLALLTISTIACDIFICYIIRGHNFYKKKKYLDVQTGADFQVEYDSLES